ncbi:MAG: hypothetical protein Q7S33_02365 [Nanoarchaeota archaeon]|nr:hypothetical protein [Nanoarchaeota archaeon]
MVLSLGMILVTMLTIPLARNQYIQEIYGFRDFSEFCKETGAIGFKQSENYDEFMQQVKEKNIWLVRTQHFNSGIWFDLWIPDEVDLLEQIK